MADKNVGQEQLNIARDVAASVGAKDEYYIHGEPQVSGTRKPKAYFTLLDDKGGVFRVEVHRIMAGGS